MSKLGIGRNNVRVVKYIHNCEIKSSFLLFNYVSKNNQVSITITFETEKKNPSVIKRTNQIT